MKSVTPFYAHATCSLCPSEVGADGVFVTREMVFCRPCAGRVRDVIEVVDHGLA